MFLSAQKGVDYRTWVLRCQRIWLQQQCDGRWLALARTPTLKVRMGIDSIIVGPEKNIHWPVIMLIYIEGIRGSLTCGQTLECCCGMGWYPVLMRLSNEGVVPTGSSLNIALNVDGTCSRCESVAGTKMMMMITVGR